MKYKIGDWVWYPYDGAAFGGEIRAISADGHVCVVSGIKCNLAIRTTDIIAMVEPKDIPIKPTKPVGIVERVAMFLDKATGARRFE